MLAVFYGYKFALMFYWGSIYTYGYYFVFSNVAVGLPSHSSSPLPPVAVA